MVVGKGRNSCKWLENQQYKNKRDRRRRKMFTRSGNFHRPANFLPETFPIVLKALIITDCLKNN